MPSRNRAGLLLAVALPLSMAGSSAAAEPRLGPVTVNGSLIEAVVEVGGGPFSSAAAPVAESLELAADGQNPLRCQTVPFGDRGLTVVVAIDVSGSMQAGPLEHLRAGLSTFAAASGPNDRIALVTFAEDLRRDSGFVPPGEPLRAAVAGLSSRGRSTELARSLLAALSLFEAPGLPVRRRLLVLSDGREEGTGHTLEEVAARARALGVVADVVGLTRVDLRHVERLMRLATDTGGLYSRVRGDAELRSVLATGLERVRAAPVLLCDAAPLADGLPHRLALRAGASPRALGPEVTITVPRRSAPTRAPTRPDRWLLAAVGGLAVLAVGAFLLAFRRRRTARAEERPEVTVVPLDDGPAPGPPASTPPPGAVEEPLPPRRPTQVSFAFPEPGQGTVAGLLVEAGPASGRRVAVAGDVFWIGAAEGNDLEVADDDLMSGHHACLRLSDGVLFLFDNASTNGTFLDDERLGPEPRPVVPGQRIRAGSTVMRVEAPRGPRP